ncbi:MAG: hypothetical protein GY934_21725, partial [Gammaproteobacteria bacterium]|nr:hypothetical protein [Gammaproteobacteria bacterium]
NTGIGTSTPAYNLDVAGDINFTGTLYENGVPFSSAIFANTTGVTSNENGTYVSDDFVFGSPQLDYDGNADHDNRMFFDKSKGAFRVGNVTGTNWDVDSLGTYSVAFGVNTKATGYSSTAMGRFTEATGDNSTAMGLSTTASGAISMAMGNGTTATGTYSTAMGFSTTATGYSSTAMGFSSEATGDYSTAMGHWTDASGYSSTAMGYYTEATGYSSTAMGYFTAASGAISTAMGYYTEATGDYSTAMGGYTAATGYYTTAMGGWTEATGTASTAMGLYTTATGYSSTAMGGYTEAESGYETAIGRYNTDYIPNSTTGWDAADRLFVIGNGTASNATSDAMVVLKNGNIGIGTSTPAYNLDVVGRAGLSTGTAWTNTSDMRLKENVHSYERGLKEILQINPIYYTYTEESGLKNPDKYGANIGISAQELQKIIPEAISVKAVTLQDGTVMEDALELTKADAMWFALINAVKEQQEIIDAQQEEIEALKSKTDDVDALKSENVEMKTEIENIKSILGASVKSD